MEENNFFKWVWRVNGLIILIVVLIIFIIILFQELRVWDSRRGEEAIITSVAEDPEGKENWVLGYPTEIRGSNYILLPLESENKEIETRNAERAKISYSGSRYYQAKNILFINKALNESHWLFNDTDQLILSTEELPRRSYTNLPENIETKVIFYEVIQIDSNQDGNLNLKDNPSLAYSTPVGNKYRVILDEYDTIIAKSLLDSDKILIVFQQKSIGYSLLFRLDPFEIISKKEIPKIENS